jgi:carbonic anhydrase
VVAVVGIVCTALVAIIAPWDGPGSSLARRFGSGYLSDETMEAAEQQFTNLFTVNLNRNKWGYGMRGGPNLWKAMFPRGSMAVGGCNGNFQSPIAVRSGGAETVIDNSHEVSMNFPVVGKWTMSRVRDRLYLQRNPAMGMGTVAYRGKSYDVRRVDLHKPAQHEVDGVIYDMELDIHCTSDDGRMLSVANFFYVDPTREYLHNRDINSHFDFHNLPQSDGDVNHLEDEFSLNFFMNPQNLTYYAYIGSQDHPPCIEGVQWIVMASPKRGFMNNGDIQFYPQDLNGNARVLQPLKGRKVYRGNKVTGVGLSYNIIDNDQTAQ